jgi:ATP-dependent Clp protease ATP-binding subunit ClpC
MPLQIAIHDKAYAWLEPLDEASVTHHTASQKAAQVLGGVVFMVSVLLAVLALFLFFMTSLGDLFLIETWFEASWRTEVLYVSILGFCYLFAHQKIIASNVAHMPKQKDDFVIGEPVALTEEAINMADLFIDESRTSVETAHFLARKFGHAQVDPLHLFVGALESAQASIALGRLGIKFDVLKDPISRRLQGRQLGDTTVLSDETEKVLLKALAKSYDQGLDAVHPLEILAAAFEVEEFVQELFLENDISVDQFENMAEWIRINERMRTRYLRFRKAAGFKPTGAMNRAMTSVATPLLDAYSEDLTTAGVNGRLPMLVGRDKEIEEVFRVIEGGGQSVVLVGPEGVGKTSVLAGIAQLMVEERVPDILKDNRLVRLSLPHLVSGASKPEAQERLLRLFVEVNKSRNIILAVTDLEEIGELASSFVDFLKRSGTFAIATTTPRAYTASIERSVLGRIFQKVDINEPDETMAIRMLESKVGGIEYGQKVIFSYDAVEKAVQLSDRYMHEMYLPKKAIMVASEAALYASKTKGQDALVTGEDIAQIVTEKTGIKATSVKSDEKEVLLNLETKMHGRVIGQDEAVKAVSAALRRARAELSSQDRPIATFLFLGPTGVGKTELAKTVAEAYFGDENSMIRLDMSEYQDQSSIHRMIGVPGSDTGGLLTEAVRKKPFSIILLDELEKAHPEILNVFLQVFDDGRLTDSGGRTIDFTNAIIVATSNAGTQYIQDAVARSEDIETIKTHLIEEELREIYRPEFLNRFDGVIVFKPLTLDEVGEIAKLMVKSVAKRLEPKGIGFRANDEAIAVLAEKGYDPKFGARPLRRVVQDEVDNAIANALLAGKVKRRDTIVLEADGSIVIEKGKAL